MKKSILIFTVVFLVIFVGCGRTNRIVGGWQAPLTVITSPYPTETDTTDDHISFYFEENFIGKEVVTRNGTSQSRPFTYEITDEELHIIFDEGFIWKFPYRIENDALILIQNGTEITYIRID